MVNTNSKYLQKLAEFLREEKHKKLVESYFITKKSLHNSSYTYLPIDARMKRDEIVKLSEPLDVSKINITPLFEEFFSNAKLHKFVGDVYVINRVVGVNESGNISRYNTFDTSKIKAFVLNNKNSRFWAFDDFDMYVCSCRYGSDGGFFSFSGYSICELEKVDSRKYNELYGNDVSRAINTYRKYMIDNLDKVEEGLGEQYKRDLIEYKNKTDKQKVKRTAK